MDPIMIALLLALALDESPKPQPAPPVAIAPAPQVQNIALTPATSPLSALADRIIMCESSGRNVSIIDSNGLPSRGIAQFQDRTWAWMSKAAGIEGSPMEPEKARAVLIWALKNGHGKHWTCYRKVTAVVY